MGRNDAAERAIAAIREESAREYLPMVGDDVAAEVERIVRERKPMRALEVGVLTGNLTIRIARDLPAGGMVIGVDIAEDLLRRARANVDLAGLGDRVSFVRGDAREALAGIEGPFDLAVFDAERSQYGNYLRAIESKLSKGAIVIAIGTDVDDPRMQKYLDHVRMSGGYDSTSVMFEEAMEVSVKK